MQTREVLLSLRLHQKTINKGWREDSRVIKKKRICKIVDFAVPANNRIKLKECEKRISTSTLQENRKTCETLK